ncbi:PhnD/SsuA/transferrin family substrate-binding protein [Desulfocapsa sulfexigens]|uniref:PhnD/SsuA/transferrin family substrate-binding protein n=1 Tax=Desulfocapsa sulfexigens TaxID=65555 RepID=UPI001427E44A|nr:PhnD/SsuA/transferrin family substrate-binding protein [Desulfocapsa sulfexigens]
MRNRYVLVYILLFLVCLCAMPAVAREIFFAPLPMEQKEKVIRQIMPMLHFLEKPLGQHLSVKYFSNYEEILDKFKTEEIDLVILGPLPYVQLRETYPDAEPVVRFLNEQGEGTYTCALVTGVESGLTSIAALKEQRLALTQPHSTCGYLCTDNLLQQVGLSVNDTDFQYLGSHQEVALAVIRGEFKAGGIKSSIGKKYVHLGLQFLAESASLPGFVLVANKRTLTDKQIEILRNVLLQLRPLDNPTHRKLVEEWGQGIRYGTLIAHDSDYDVIRDQLRGVIIPSKDFH